MKIKANHFYRTDSGTIVGPMTLTEDGWFWTAPGYSHDEWYAEGNLYYGHADGCIYFDQAPHPSDIVAEVDLFDIRIPFQFLSENMQMFLETTEAQLEVLDASGWTTTDRIEGPHLVYRVAKPSTPMTIPWDAINPKYCYAAKDKNGSIWVYSEKPRTNKSTWGGGENPMPIHELMLGVDPGTVPWDRSLQERPA